MSKIDVKFSQVEVTVNKTITRLEPIFNPVSKLPGILIHVKDTTAPIYCPMTVEDAAEFCMQLCGMVERAAEAELKIQESILDLLQSPITKKEEMN